MITVAGLGLMLPIITVLLLHPTYYQTWKRGYKYVQQKIIDHGRTVFTFTGSRGVGSIRGEESEAAASSPD